MVLVVEGILSSMSPLSHAGTSLRNPWFVGHRIVGCLVRTPQKTLGRLGQAPRLAYFLSGSFQ